MTKAQVATLAAAETTLGELGASLEQAFPKSSGLGGSVVPALVHEMSDAIRSLARIRLCLTVTKPV